MELVLSFFGGRKESKGALATLTWAQSVQILLVDAFQNKQQ